MISEVHNALFDFWSQFGLPVFLTGNVPVNQKGEIMTEYPYITIGVDNGDALEMGVLTAFCWHKKRSGVNYNEERIALLDRISEAIPASGTLLETEHGKLYLFRSTTFQTYYDDYTDSSVVGSRTSYNIKYYTK